MNTFGNLFRITSFGESHGKALGVIIDNLPPNIKLCETDIQGGFGLYYQPGPGTPAPD